MSKLIGTKIIQIDGQEVECKVYSTRKCIGANTFSHKMKIRGKDSLRTIHGRKAEIRTCNVSDTGVDKKVKRDRVCRKPDPDTLVYRISADSRAE